MLVTFQQFSLKADGLWICCRVLYTCSDLMRNSLSYLGGYFL